MWTSTRTLSCRFLMHLHWVQKAHIEPCAHTDRDDCAEILNHLLSSNQTMAWIVEVFYVLPGWSNGCARGRWPSWSSALWSQNMAMPLCIFLFPRRSRFMLPLRFGPTSRVASQTSSCFSSSWIQTQTSGCNDFVTGRASLRWKFWKGLYRLEMPPSMPSCLVSFQPRTDLAMSPYRSMWTMQRCWAEKKLVNISTSQLDFKKFLSLTCQH